MAYGGYKFKGYKVVRSNLETNTYSNWCLLVHQARIKAFMESCALSGALWHFSKTNGPLAFEDYGNVIYRVADVESNYTNYMSFFQYGSEDAYYMIATLGGCTSESGYSGTKVDYRGIKALYWSNIYSYIASMSSALSLEDFTEDGIFANYPTSALFCSSVMCDEKVASSNAIITSNNTNFAVPKSSCLLVGFATKGKDIISINTIDNATVPFSFCVESIGGLSNIYSTTDTNNIFKACIRSRSTNEGYTTINNNFINGGMCETLTYSGVRLGYNRLNITSSSSYWGLFISVPVAPTFSTVTNNVPFQSPDLICSRNIPHWMNNEHFTAKGTINKELVSYNASCTSSTNCPNQGATALGGNLLSVGALSSNTNYTMMGGGAMQNISNTIYPCGYVGWDPSNPDITNESSWPELALQE